MDLHSERTEGAVVLAPVGRIDHTHADAFKQSLDPFLAACTREGSAIVIDFFGVSYISSIGLRALMIAAKQAKAQGGRIVLAALTPLVLEVFRISRFDLVFEIFPDRAAALTALATPA